MLRLSLALALFMAACGPSPVATDPPPAETGTAALRFGAEPDVTFETTPVICGTPEGFTPIAGQVVCELGNRGADGLTTDRLALTLHIDSLAALPEGTELRTGTEIGLTNVSAGVGGASLGASTSSWDGTLLITLGPRATPRTATLDGALSSVFDDLRIAMSFESLPIVIVEVTEP